MAVEEEHERFRAERQAALGAILDSAADKKLIVSGPGTGKTFAFKQALERAGGGVALTFIRALVRDLRVALADPAEIVNTFHGFAKHLLHNHPYGVSASFWYCPGLPIVFARDLTLLGRDAISASDVDSAFQELDDAEGLTRRAFASATTTTLSATTMSSTASSADSKSHRTAYPNTRLSSLTSTRTSTRSRQA